MKVAFDCDGTLVGYDGQLRKEVCELMIAFISCGFRVIVWSGGGKDYADSVFRRVVREYDLVERLGSVALAGVVRKMKDNSKPELAIDDQSVNLGHFNLQWTPWIYAEKEEE